MADIRNFIKSHLLEPLKQYPTVIQDTMLEIIIDRLEELYEYTWKFPEILSPNQNRLDILQAIANQFLFTVRDDADIQEQVDILNNILYVYNRRGSIDTIENMWKYYGGELPKDVEVIIPSYNLFRYSISELSGTHSFIKGSAKSVTLDTKAPRDIEIGSLVSVVGTNRLIVTPNRILKGSSQVSLANIEGLKIGDKLRVDDEYEGVITGILGDTRVDTTVNRPGVYEIKLINNTYPIPDLKEFLLKELVAAGNEIYFTNVLHMHITGEYADTNPYKYLIRHDDFFDIQMPVLKSSNGFTWSGINPLDGAGNSRWSGKSTLWPELLHMFDIGPIFLGTYLPYALTLCMMQAPLMIEYDILPSYLDRLEFTELYSTSSMTPYKLDNHLYDDQGEIISKYPGYFIVGETLLSSPIN